MFKKLFVFSLIAFFLVIVSTIVIAETTKVQAGHKQMVEVDWAYKWQYLEPYCGHILERGKVYDVGLNIIFAKRDFINRVALEFSEQILFISLPADSKDEIVIEVRLRVEFRGYLPRIMRIGFYREDKLVGEFYQLKMDGQHPMFGYPLLPIVEVGGVVPTINFFIPESPAKGKVFKPGPLWVKRVNSTCADDFLKNIFGIR